jgi:hypothetical protein
MRRHLVLFCIFCISAVCHAQRVKVKFSCDCSDQVGSLYATALRDSLAASPRFVETADDSEPKSDGSKDRLYHLVIQVVSVDIENPPEGRQSALSVVFTFAGSLLGQRVQVCGAQSVVQCVASTLASFDNALH